MTIVFQNNADAGTPGTTATAANSANSGTAFSLFNAPAGTGGTPSITYIADSAHGAAAYRMVHNSSTAAQGNIFRWNPPTALTTVAVRFYMRIDSYPGASTPIMNASSGTGTTAVVQLTLGTTGRLQAQNAASTITSFGNSIPLNTWIRVEAWVTVGTTSSNGSYHIGWAVGDTPTFNSVYDNDAYNAGTAGITRMQWGRVSGTWADAIQDLDEFVITDQPEFVGPYADPTRFFLWDGTTEIPLTLDGVWNGTTIITGVTATTTS